MRKEEALHAFMDKIAEARTALDELSTFVDNHMEKDPDSITWGAVGDAGYLVARLTEVTDWVFKRDEYAE